MSYRLVACDLDGTVIGDDLRISARTKMAVRRLQEAGIGVTIATGRMFQSSLYFAREMGITLPLICYQGAMIRDPLTGKTVYHRPIPVALAREVITTIKPMGLHLNAYIDDELYVERVSAEAESYARLAQVQVHAVGDLLSFLDSKEPTKLVIVSDEPTTIRLVRDFQQKFGPSLYVTQSFPNFCEFAHPECNKGKALARLSAILDIPQEETVAIGDNPNDLDMIEWAGLGIAVANACSQLIEAADYVTGAQDEDGAAQVMEKIAADEPLVIGKRQQS